MLRIHTVTSAAGAKRYYAASDYYDQGQETIGQWGGSLSQEFSLAGTVGKAAFDRLCDGLHPVTGEKLTPRKNDFRRIGYDFVFSGPKSFSVLLGLLEDSDPLKAELEGAFRDSVADSMAVVEADMQARIRKAGVYDDRTTGNMVYAGFDHTTSRPVDDEAPDPQRHTHIFCFNATRDPVEGRIKAGQFAGIKRDGAFFEAFFYARLAARLRAMGWGIERKGGQAWEIAGIPESVIKAFSKRTAQVEEEHERRLKNDPEYQDSYKYDLGAKTRGGKRKDLTPTELRAAWWAQMSEEDRKAVGRVMRREAVAGSEPVSVSEAVDYACKHCFERASVVPERALVEHALRFGIGGVTPEAVREEMARQGVITVTRGGRMLATTPALQREEQYLIGIGKWLPGVAPVGVPEGVTKGMLKDDQWHAVQGLLGSHSRVNLIDAAAGTGKSTLLKAYDQALRMQGQGVTYLATSAAAVKVLRDDGFDAVTVARFLIDRELQDKAAHGRVVVDEASMLGHREAHALFGLGVAKLSSGARCA